MQARAEHAQSKTSYSCCCEPSSVLTSINATPAFSSKPKQNNSASLERRRQTATQTLFNAEHGAAGGETEDALSAQSNSVWTSLLFFHSSLTFAPLSCRVQGCAGKKKKKVYPPYLATHFLNRPIRGGRLLRFRLLVGWHEPYFHPRSLNNSFLGNGATGVLLLYNCNQHSCCLMLPKCT